jgi:hypothetical protein
MRQWEQDIKWNPPDNEGQISKTETDKTGITQKAAIKLSLLALIMRWSRALRLSVDVQLWNYYSHRPLPRINSKSNELRRNESLNCDPVWYSSQAWPLTSTIIHHIPPRFHFIHENNYSDLSNSQVQKQCVPYHITNINIQNQQFFHNFHSFIVD